MKRKSPPMSDKVKIYAGLAAFVVLVGFPVWHALASAESGARPELELPAGETQCIEETAYMTANHMNLLNGWRNAVVREGARDYVATSGESYVMSLTATCLGCHSDVETFCTRCHDYANVAPKCWDCHVTPGGN